MSGFRVGGVLRLLGSWYVTPAGLLYVGSLVVGCAVSTVQDSLVGIGVAVGFILLVLIPYKLARERRDWRVGDRAQGRALRRRAVALRRGIRRLDAGLISERTAMLGSLETVRRESRDVIWSERLYWRAALDHLESGAGDLAAKVERSELQMGEAAVRLLRIERELADLATRLGVTTQGGDGPDTHS